MMGSALQDKSKAFALEIIRVCNEVKGSKRESVFTNQLLRSGTSVGANIRESFYAHGRADFIAKLQSAIFGRRLPIILIPSSRFTLH